MDSFFSFFGKFAVIVLVVGLLVGGGYYLGTGKLPVLPQNPAPAAVTTTAPTEMVTDTPTPTVASQLYTITPVTGTSFTAYSFTAPSAWIVTKEATAGVSQKTMLTKGEYIISIYQAPTGGGGCTYPGDPEQDMSSPFGPFVTIHDGNGLEYRRATPAGSVNTFTVCQKASSSFGLPTSFGHITYSVPSAADPAILQEMDAIFATFKKS